MNKKTLTAAKLSLTNIKKAYFIVAIICLAIISNYITSIFVTASRENLIVSAGDTFFLLVIFAAIFLPTQVFRRFINIGGKRIDFFKGCAVAYLILAVIAALASLIFCYTVDRLMLNYIRGVMNLNLVFGFANRGPIIAFFQYTALAVFSAAFTHTLVCMQDRWYGWATDIVIITIISVFTPIARLRALEVRFFNMIIFQANPFLQILSCVILAVLIYGLSLPVLNRKSM